ncbi:Golgi SNAP receptor complex member 1-1 [Senna tora]|uniref:Golgi SNAP receptor complex member 1-1 n=1 Tax=Senna tora TaxID=362788 RepID=A0A834T3E2_9FABA|nr:Golgi SNAP receptor complex member 1-1 [Senna tora]
MEVPSSWDALRKQARKLEAQLDEQINAYRKLVSAKASTKADTAESDIESRTEQLLNQLQQVNSQMQAWVSSGGSEMVSHTLTRHQEILQDLSQEFYRLRSSLRAKKEHASLLEDFKEFDRSKLDLEAGGGSAEQALLIEHASISRSTGQMDNVISQAQATLGALVLQRSTFGGINSKLSNISSRLPTSLNSRWRMKDLILQPEKILVEKREYPDLLPSSISSLSPDLLPVRHSHQICYQLVAKNRRERERGESIHNLGYICEGQFCPKNINSMESQTVHHRYDGRPIPIHDGVQLSNGIKGTIPNIVE